MKGVCWVWFLDPVLAFPPHCLQAGLVNLTESRDHGHGRLSAPRSVPGASLLAFLPIHLDPLTGPASLPPQSSPSHAPAAHSAVAEVTGGVCVSLVPTPGPSYGVSTLQPKESFQNTTWTR